MGVGVRRGWWMYRFDTEWLEKEMGNGKGRFNQQLHCGKESGLVEGTTEKGHKNRMTGKKYE